MSRIPVSAWFISITAVLAARQGGSNGLVVRSSSRLVQVNVVVHDRKGAVANLAKEDFEVFDRGKKQNIAIFSVENAGEMNGSQRRLGKNTFSNQRTEHSSMPANLTVVLLDGLNTRFEDQAKAKRDLMRYLAGVDPSSRLALYTLGKTLKVLSDFNDAAQLKQILSKRGGAANTEVAESEPEPASTGIPEFDAALNSANETFAAAAIADRAQITMHAFASIANHLAALPGRKNLIWICGGSPFSVRALAKTMNNADIAIYPIDARGLVGLLPQATAGSEPRPVRGRSPAQKSFRPGGIDAMQEIAEETGGRALYDTNDLSGAIREAQKDSAVAYTLGYYPGANSLDGEFHEIRVRVSRPGLSVRYRKGYFAPAGGGTASGVQQALDEALWGPLEASSVALRARVERVGGTQAEALNITYSLDIRTLQLTEADGIWRGSINAVFMLEAGGDVLDTAQEAFDLNFAKDVYDSYLKKGLVFQQRVPAKAGWSALRIVVASRTNGAVGSLLIPSSEVR